jgi:hypothetical protein
VAGGSTATGRSRRWTGARVERTGERRSEGGGLRPHGALWAGILTPTSIGPMRALMGLLIFFFFFSDLTANYRKIC